jgi:dTDP-4-dehydrorhamnose reductase
MACGHKERDTPVKIVITGARGQVGSALVDTLQGQHQIIPLDRGDIDIARPDVTGVVLDRQPDLVIHTAAFTNVDACARHPDDALAINGLGTKHIALACQQLDVPLVYISTNEVFDGRSDRPYLEFDQTNPINPYGYSKWVGEQVVQQLLRRFYIVRIAWVFGGDRNFVRSILRLARERGELAVVDDEIGNPTYAPDLAQTIARLIQHPSYGIYHLTNEGVCSRYDFAAEILRQAGLTHALLRRIKLDDYQRDSTPPPYGALRNFVAATELGIQLRPWQAALDDFLSAISSDPAP